METARDWLPGEVTRLGSRAYGTVALKAKDTLRMWWIKKEANSVSFAVCLHRFPVSVTVCVTGNSYVRKKGLPFIHSVGTSSP